MIVLDENFPDNQRQLLKSWHIRFRQIGYEIGRSGMKDHEIIPLLLQIRRPTFFALMMIFINVLGVMHATAWLTSMSGSMKQQLLFVACFAIHNLTPMQNAWET